jgi:hypothetical protein
MDIYPVFGHINRSAQIPKVVTLFISHLKLLPELTTTHSIDQPLRSYVDT